MAIDAPIVNSAQAEGHVKVKKSKKEKRGTDTGDIDDVGVKPKSKKRKVKPQDAVSPTDSSTEVFVAEEPTSSQKLDKKLKKRKLDSNDISGPVKEKKKKRKEHVEETIVPQDEAAEASAPQEKEKKKKRKHADEELHADPESVSHRKEKKQKKHKVDGDSSEQISASSSKAQSVVPSTSVLDVEAFLAKHSVTIHSKTAPPPILTFDQLDVPARLRAACDGFKEPTPIQACSWPPALAGQDVVGIAETGSGKTLAFGLPALARLLSSAIPAPTKGSSTVSVLVMAPTRELAIQTHDTLAALGEPFGIASVAVFGGVDKRGQIDALRNISKEKGAKRKTTTRIIVGTPGRILDLVNDSVCDLSNVRYLVLDEADRMLDKGFENDIRSIIGHTQQGAARQTLMFSATWPDAVRRLASTFQRDPVRVTVGSDDLTANSRVEQVVQVFDDSRSKEYVMWFAWVNDYLSRRDDLVNSTRLLDQLKTLIPKKQIGPEETRILVFALYKKEAERVEGMLRSKGFRVGGLHGDMSQTARMEALENFKTGRTGLLVATDVAARGLDIPNVAAVINYTFPLTIEDYIHRIGRTGRGGKSGKSITFFTGDLHERALAGELARVLRESGFECEGLKKFPMTIKKKTHSAYGAFFRDDVAVPSGPTKIKFT